MTETSTSFPLRLVDLEAEVLAEILGYVNDASPWTTSALALVNRHVYAAVKQVRYHHTVIDWSFDQSTWVVTRKKSVRERNKPPMSQMGHMTVNFKDPDFLERVRILTVGAMLVRSMAKCQSIADSSLVDMLSTASNIKVINWKLRSLPSAGVIEAVEKYHPRAQLRIYRIYSYGPEFSERLANAEAALCMATCLRSLAIQSHDLHRAQQPFADYRRVITNAPNLVYLSHISDFPNTVPESVDSTGTKKALSIRHLTLDGWPLADSTVDFWANYINLSRLESFKCSRGILSATYFERATELLSGLKHVSLNLNTVTVDEETAKAAQKYITTCSSLTTLSLWSWMGKVPLETILQQHGPTLHSLQLHEREEIGQPGGERVLSLDDVRSIRTTSPNLKKLTFDIQRKSKRPRIDDHREIFEELKAMELDSLEIYLDSGISYVIRKCREEVFFSHDEHRDDEDEAADENQDEDDDAADVDKDISIAARAPAKAPIRNMCGGAFDSTGLEPIQIEEGPANDSPVHDESTKIIYHPPTSADDICTFTNEAWKFIFGQRASGPRLLDLKFGEWERRRGDHVHINHPDGGLFEDIRVWTRAKPHERDDRKGECFGEMKCCEGKHWKKWASTS